MASTEKKQEAEALALAIAERLKALQPELWSERHWADKAGVSASFFSNLRGTPTKPPSVPSVKQLADVLAAVNVSLSEFFLPDARGKVGRVPSEQALERRLSMALVELPKKPADRLPYLLDTVLGVLGLPGNQRAIQRADPTAAGGAHEEDAPPLAATK